MSKINDIINQLVAETLKEIKLHEKLRGGFNLSHFLKLSSTASLEELEAYLRETLGEPLGKGSSRIVWALSSNKVLKLARKRSGDMNGAGQAQNEAEVDLWTNPKVQPIVAKIYNYDPEYKWLMSELTKPLTMEDIEKYFNTTHETFNTVLRLSLDSDTDLMEYFKSKIKNHEKKKLYYTSRIKVIEKEIESIKKKDPEFTNKATGFKIYEKENEKVEFERMLKETQLEIDSLSNVKLDKLEPVIAGIKAMKEELGFVSDDILRYEHYGRTADGRLVVIDYGLTDDIYDKFYKD